MIEKLTKYGTVIHSDNPKFENIGLYLLNKSQAKKIYFFLEENEEEDTQNLTIIVSGKNKNKDNDNTEPIQHTFIIHRLKFIDYILFYIRQQLWQFEEFTPAEAKEFLEKMDTKVIKAQKPKQKGRGYEIVKGFNLVYT